MKSKLTKMQVAAGFIGLSLIVGGGSLWSGYAQVQADKATQHHDDVARQRAAEAVEAKLCSTFGRLAALKPPPGDPRANPSRAFLQGEHATLVQLGDDLGCKALDRKIPAPGGGSGRGDLGGWSLGPGVPHRGLPSFVGALLARQRFTTS